ncbi:hypothetical protein LFL96_24775 [Paraburkholderia sp. D15]|uniref:hypothetical protein n=1 Tax=Paraburkholderia sp. D15 TaxID=2880218 RepID=UPI002478EA03|nr:hypothetical protein [Paraburkholderia sp. D15]WGS54244.1 hypothetical protein LFL96_24775 [Paraburkholderia sp. D15]
MQAATAAPFVWFLSFIEHDATRNGIESRVLRALAPFSLLSPRLLPLPFSEAATQLALAGRVVRRSNASWSPAPQSPWRIVLAITGNPPLSRRRDRNPTTPLDG